MTGGIPAQPTGSVVDTLIRVRTREEPGAVVLEVRGEVDLLTAPRLACALTEQLDGRAPVVVADLSEVDFFGAAGLEVLGAARHRAERAGVALRLRAGPPVRRLLSLVQPEQDPALREDH